jgi:hypothetical protein
MQHPMGQLVSQLVAKPDEMHKILENFLQYDDFLAKLVKVSKRVNALKGTPKHQPI